MDLGNPAKEKYSNSRSHVQESEQIRELIHENCTGGVGVADRSKRRIAGNNPAINRLTYYSKSRGSSGNRNVKTAREEKGGAFLSDGKIIVGKKRKTQAGRVKEKGLKTFGLYKTSLGRHFI